jgi:cytochrome P450
VLDAWGDFDEELRADPYPLYAELRASAPVHRATLADGRHAWLVTRYHDAHRALNDPRLSKDFRRAQAAGPDVAPPDLPGFLAGRNMLYADPPDHTRLRTLVSRAFTPRRVEALRPRVQEITNALLDEMADAEGAVDLIGAFAFPLPMTVICELLGVPAADRVDLRAWFTILFTSAHTGTGVAEAAGEVFRYLAGLLAAKRAAPQDDLLSALIEACDGDQRLDEWELLATVAVLVAAGHETTVNLIATGTLALLRNPEQLAALRGDESVIPNAVEELLRYDGPTQHATFRFTTEPVEISGITIPAHQPVLVLLGAANRDPARFTRPDSLDVRRTDNRHLGLGHGIHFCLGAPLARMEGQIAFASLLRRFPHLRLAVAPDELRWRHGLVVRGLCELPVSLTPVRVAS